MQNLYIEPQDAESRSAHFLEGCKERTSQPASVVAAKVTIPRKRLTPAKIGVAWQRLRHAVREFCRQPGRGCVLCEMYGNRIEFQCAPNSSRIVLILDGSRIRKGIAGKRETIRIVRIKSGGSGFELRQSLHSATRLLIELMREALVNKAENTIDLRSRL